MHKKLRVYPNYTFGGVYLKFIPEIPISWPATGELMLTCFPVGGLFFLYEVAGMKNE